MFCDVVYWELSEAVRMPRFLGYEYGYGGRGTRDEIVGVYTGDWNISVCNN
jgi:hypothetical protein